LRMRIGATASVLFTMCGLCVDTQADAQRASEDRIAAFEASSIKRRDPGGPTVPMLMNVTPGRIHFQAVTLRDCIRWAYSLADYQVSGGPPWVAGSPRWDIDAAADGPATDVQMREMFRTVLAERFGLKVSRTMQETRVYLMSVSRPGPRLKRADEDAPRTDDWRRSPLFQTTKAGPGSTRVRELSARRATMRQLTEYLSRQLRVAVVDRTGLEGDFGFTLEWPADPLTVADSATPRLRGTPPPPVDPLADLFGSAGVAALRDQLGLTLESARAPIEVLTIEAVHEATAN
jgi:uncharacterized protein (TIGR03435 family)